MKARSIEELREVAIGAGWAKAKSINCSHYLGKAQGLAIRTPDGWKLTSPGREHVARFVASTGKTAVVPPPMAQELRGHLSKLKSNDTRAFVEEAVKSHEAGHYRSAIVLSWVGAISLLYDHVVASKLSEFNTEALRRDAKWRAAKNPDGLARIGEYDFLQIVAAIGIIGKNVKDELEGCLKLRNGCGHPNSLRVAQNRVAAHIEILMLNVFEKF